MREGTLLRHPSKHVVFTIVGFIIENIKDIFISLCSDDNDDGDDDDNNDDDDGRGGDDVDVVTTT